VVPWPNPVEAFPDRALTALRVGTQGGKHVVDFFSRRTARQVYRGNPVPVKPVRQVAQQGVLGVGRHRLDHQPVARHAERDGFPVVEEQVQAAGESLCGFLEVGMPGRVHGAFVKDDRELNQEISEVSGE
jgi:hypothetical protein